MNSSSELENELLNSAVTEAQQSDQPSELVDKEKITFEYLQNNPDFFNQHTDILAELKIPHATGSAVSLVERQVTILREQNTRHKVHLAELVEIAKDNELSNLRMHKLTLALLDCNSINASEVVLEDILGDDFSVDAVALKLFIDPIDEQADHLFIEADSMLAKELEKLLNTRKPMCGFFKQLPLEELFESSSQSISSMVTIPLFVEKNNCFGVLVLGSNNVRRFNTEMGTLFLERLGETLSHILKNSIKKGLNPTDY